MISRSLVINVNFHNAIARATHNALYVRISEILSLMLTALGQGWQTDGSDIDGSFYHGMIIRSITSRKPEEASFFMQRHMSLIIERMAEQLGKSESHS